MLACCCFHSFFHRLLFLPHFYFLLSLRLLFLSLSLSINHLCSLSEFCFCCCCFYYDYTNTARAFVVVVVVLFIFCLSFRPSLSDVWPNDVTWHISIVCLNVCVSEWVCVYLKEPFFVILLKLFFLFLMMNKSFFTRMGVSEETRVNK